MRILPTSNHKDFKVSFMSKPREGNPEMGTQKWEEESWGLGSQAFKSFAFIFR